MNHIKFIVPLLLMALTASATVYVKDSVVTNGTDCFTIGNLAGQSATNSTLGLSKTSGWPSTGTSVFQVDALGLSYPGNILLAGAGGAFVVVNSAANSDGRMLTRTMSGLPTSGSIYFSLLLRAGTGFTNALVDGHSVGMGMGTWSFSGTLATSQVSTNGVHFGFQKSGGTPSLMLRVNGTNYVLVANPVPDRTYLCVAKIELGAGPGATDIVRAAADPSAPDSFSLAVTNRIVSSGTTFTNMTISGTYRTGGKKGYFDEYRLGNTWADVAPIPDASYPVFNNPPTVTVDGSNAFVFSATLNEGSAQTAVIACYGTTQGSASASSWELSKLVTATPTLGVAATTVLDNLVTNTSYYYAALGTNANNSVLKTGGTLLMGEVWLTLGADAFEEGLLSGSAVVRRPASATQTPLTVNYTVSGSAVTGVNYVSGSLPGSVTIPAGQDSVAIPVLPLVEAANISDTTVVLTLASGAYFIGASNATTVTVQNYDYPADKNCWIAATAGNASAASNWSQNRAPNGSDDILLDVFSTANMTWDVNGVNGLPDTVASWTQTSNYTGTVTFPVQYTNVVGAVFTNFAIAGNATINGGTWTHPSNNTAQVYHLQASVGGDLIIGSAAKMNVQGRGYGLNRFPAGGALGIHGGSRDTFSNVYGNVYCPADIGAANWAQTGGGAIWLEVAGATTIAGAVNAKAADSGAETAVGAGGSVYLRTKSASGTGTISVSGNGYYNQSSGSGGRMALVLTEAETLGMNSANLTARGGWGNTSTGAGTILIKSFGQAYGTLIVDNLGARSYGCQPPTKYGTTCIAPGQTWTFDSILFRNYGVLSIPAGTTLNLPSGLPSVSSLNTAYQSGMLYMGGTMDLGVGTLRTFTSNWVFQADSPYVITGDVTVANGGAIGSIPLIRNMLAAYAKMDLSIVGNLNVASGGKIIADNAGVDYPADLSGTKGYHGGQSAADATNKGYDSILNPTLPGNAGQSGDRATITGGGGALLLTVSGNLNVDGAISSTSARGGYWPGAGGTINIRAGTLTGAGTIRANGGVGASTVYAGGGGRVAIRLTEAGATFEAFGVTDISASGVSSSSTTASYLSSAGTVYLQTAAQPEGEGQVIVRNDNYSINTNSATWFPSTASGGAADVFTRVSLSIEDYAIVKLSTNNVKMAALTIEANTKLDLNGYTLSLGDMTVGATRIAPGSYPASYFATGVTDSSPGVTGQIVVKGKGTLIMIF